MDEQQWAARVKREPQSVLSFAGSVTYNKSLKLLDLQFPQLDNGDVELLILLVVGLKMKRNARVKFFVKFKVLYKYKLSKA